jgi:hypothetical protein
VFCVCLWSVDVCVSMCVLVCTCVRVCTFVRVKTGLDSAKIRQFFRDFHTLYCDTVSNPFYEVGSPIASARFKVLNLDYCHFFSLFRFLSVVLLVFFVSFLPFPPFDPRFLFPFFVSFS